MILHPFTRCARALLAFAGFAPARPLDPRTTLEPRIVVRPDGLAYVVFSSRPGRRKASK